jgi:hypothetical protein
MLVFFRKESGELAAADKLTRLGEMAEGFINAVKLSRKAVMCSGDLWVMIRATALGKIPKNVRCQSGPARLFS